MHPKAFEAKKMTHCRFTLRTLMLVVFAASLAIWSYMMWNRSTQFAMEAQRHHGRLIWSRGNLYAYEFDHHVYPPKLNEFMWESEQTECAILTSWIRYDERLVQKYERAAMSPWLPVDGDPPLPSPAPPQWPRRNPPQWWSGWWW